jgi:hypothetical protein
MGTMPMTMDWMFQKTVSALTSARPLSVSVK